MQFTVSFTRLALVLLSCVALGGSSGLHAHLRPMLMLSPGTAFKYERIDKNNSVLLVVDHQEGLFQLARDFHPVEFKNNLLAHAELAKVFNLPTVLTSSADQGEAVHRVVPWGLSTLI